MPVQEDVENDLALLIAKVTGNDPRTEFPGQPLAGMSLRDELDIDSLALVELTDEIEDRFGLKIPDDDRDQLTTFGGVTAYLNARA